MDLTTQVSSVGGTDSRWLRSRHGINNGLVRTLDISKFTSGTHYDAVTKVLKSGIGLAIITATGLYGPYDTTASDGRQLVLDSILLTDQPLLLENGTTSTKVAAAVIRHGIIATGFLPVAAQKPAGASDLTAASTKASFIWES